MRCERCGNEDPLYFYCDRDVWYCRKCIGFGRINIGEPIPPHPCVRKQHHCHYTLKYPLTPQQRTAVTSIMECLHRKQDVLVYAACGARQNRVDDGSNSEIS